MVGAAQALWILGSSKAARTRRFCPTRHTNTSDQGEPLISANLHSFRKPELGSTLSPRMRLDASRAYLFCAGFGFLRCARGFPRGRGKRHARHARRVRSHSQLRFPGSYCIQRDLSLAKKRLGSREPFSLKSAKISADERFLSYVTSRWPGSMRRAARSILAGAGRRR